MKVGLEIFRVILFLAVAAVLGILLGLAILCRATFALLAWVLVATIAALWAATA